MTLLFAVLRFLANLGFYAFLAGYWYLVNSLHPHLAVIGAGLAWLTYQLLASRVRVALPQPALLLITAVLFYLMLNPLPSLRGLAQMLWLAGSAILFRLGFAQILSLKYRAGALLVSYVLFLALPLGLPRLGPTAPSVQEGQPLDVVVVGAGFGGIAIGKELLDSGITNFRIYEAAPEVGGTWWHNRYPGNAVHIPL